MRGNYMIIDRDKYMTHLKNLVGERDDEETLGIIADMTDTYNDLETRSQGSRDWEEKYNNLRKEYKDRFFSDTPSNFEESEIIEDDTEEEEKKTFESLFKEGE